LATGRRRVAPLVLCDRRVGVDAVSGRSVDADGAGGWADENGVVASVLNTRDPHALEARVCAYGHDNGDRRAGDLCPYRGRWRRAEEVGECALHEPLHSRISGNGVSLVGAKCIERPAELVRPAGEDACAGRIDVADRVGVPVLVTAALAVDICFVQYSSCPKMTRRAAGERSRRQALNWRVSCNHAGSIAKP
jgi:hypothetical protein